MNFPFGQTITRLRWSYAPDAYGDLQRVDPPTPTDIANCAVAPRSSSDVTEPARQGVIVGLSVYITDVTTDIDAVTDQIRYGGAVYDIDGDIGEWRNPFTSQSGIEFALRRAIG